MMSQRDLVLSAGHGERPGRVPVTPYAGNFAARLIGMPIDRYCAGWEELVSAQLAAQGLTGHDVLVAQSDGYYIAEGFGLETRRRSDDTPIPVKPLFENASEAAQLVVPDPGRDGRMPVYLEAVRELRSRAGDRLAVRATGTGPLSLAGHLLGTERFVMQLSVLEVEPDPAAESAMKLVMEMCTEATTRFALAALDIGADIVQIGDSLASLDMISPAIYRKWALPYERRFFDQVRPAADARGALGLLHLCGDTTVILDDMADTGAHVLEVDWKVDLRKAHEIIGGRVALMGNLDPSSILLRGTPEIVKQAAIGAIQATEGLNGGFLLGSGCEVAPDTPLENMRALLEAVG